MHFITLMENQATDYQNIAPISYLLGAILTIAIMGVIAMMFLNLSHEMLIDVEAQLVQAESERHEQLSGYNSLLANMHTGLAYHRIILDEAGAPSDYVYLDVNPAFCDLLEFRRDFVIGKRVREVFPGIEEDPANWIQTYGVVALDQKSLTFERYFQALEKWFLITAYSPKKEFFITIVSDIPENKSQELESIRQQKLTSISELAGGIAHDFNNLLVGIMGNVNLLQFSETLSIDEQDILQDLEQAANRAKGLTNQLLTFAKGGEPVKQEVNLNFILQNAVNLVFRGKPVLPNVLLDPDLPLIFGDPDQLHQVAVNLLLNALQAVDDKGKIDVQTSTVELTNGKYGQIMPGTYCKVLIQDNGPGIPDSLKNRIFEPYFTTKPNGTGLGLATSYSILRKHEGILDFHTNASLGTAFFFLLPPAHISVQSPLSPFSEQYTIKVDNFPQRVLVLDDEPHIHKLLRRIFLRYNIPMDSSFDGNETIEMYRQALASDRPYDLMILDLTIPGGTGGFEALQRIKAINPEVTAVVSSGYSNDPIVANFRRFGFKAELTKPFKVEQVYRVLSGLEYCRFKGVN